MYDFKFELGQIVRIDPTNSGKGEQAIVVAQVQFIEGTRGYMVTTSHFGTHGVVRHSVTEYEIQPDD